MITYRFALFLRLGTGAASAAVALRMPGMTKLRSVARLSMRASCWLANAELVAALTLLTQRLANLALDPAQSDTSTITSQVGTTLRGPNALHVTFTPR
jgi:hypothetical protein